MPKLDPDWQPRDERDARIEELEEELDSYMRATENLAHKLSTAEAEVERLWRKVEFATTSRELAAEQSAGVARFRVKELETEVERSHKAILALTGEIERLRAQALSMTVFAQDQDAKIEAALALHKPVKPVETGMRGPMLCSVCTHGPQSQLSAPWPCPTVKALKGE